MDLIYTDAKRVDQGVLSAYSFDLSFGASENDFEMTLGVSEPTLEFGTFVYIEGTEYGGIVDGKSINSTSNTLTYKGRTWHGILNSKVIEPDPGADYLIVSGDANQVISALVERFGLSSLFAADLELSGIEITNYKFKRYCFGYDEICDMLSSKGAKLKIVWQNRTVLLRAEPIVDYTKAPLDGDTATLKVEQQKNKVNHMICLGRGDLAEREVVHLYVDQFGAIGGTQYYAGLDEITGVYENTNAESSEELRRGGISRLKELWNADKAEVSLNENNDLIYDIGDIVGVSDIKSGSNVTAAVSQKIVKINNGAIRTEYKTGG